MKSSRFPTSARWIVRPFRYALLVLALISSLGSFGCGVLGGFVSGFPEPIDLVPEGDTLECFVDIRPQDMAGVSRTTLSSRGPEFLTGDSGDELRRYQLSRDCAAGLAFPTLEEAEADWRLWSSRRVGQLVEAGDPMFSAEGIEWCEVSGTLRCLTREPIETCRGNIISTDQLTNAPLPTCAVPPDPFEVSCDGEICEEVDFGPVQVGLDPPSTASKVLIVRNDGAPGAVDMTINYDGMLLPADTADPVADFSVEGNQCRDDDGIVLPPGNECMFSIVFAPEAVGDHAANIPFTYSYPDDEGTVQGSKSLAVSGTGDGGELALNPATDICLAAVGPNGCTAPVTLQITNNGMAPVTIDCVGFNLDSPDDRCPGFVADDGFELRAVSGAAAPLLLGPGAAESFDLRWCGDAAGLAAATLEVRSDDLTQPELTLGIERQLTCP